MTAQARGRHNRKPVSMHDCLYTFVVASQCTFSAWLNYDAHRVESAFRLFMQSVYRVPRGRTPPLCLDLGMMWTCTKSGSGLGAALTLVCTMRAGANEGLCLPI